MTLENPSYHLIKELIEKGDYIRASDLCDSLPESNTSLMYQFWNYLNFPMPIISNELQNKLDLVIQAHQDQTDLYLLALISKCKYFSLKYLVTDFDKEKIIGILEEIEKIIESNNEFEFKEFSLIEIKLFYIFFKGMVFRRLEKSKKIILEQLTNGYELAEKYNFQIIKRRFCQWISISNHNIGNLKLSLEWRKKGLAISKLLKNDYFIAYDLTGIATVYGWQGNFDECKKTLDQIRVISESRQEPYFRVLYANSLNLLAQLEIMTNKLEDARGNLEKGISILESLKNCNKISEYTFINYATEIWQFFNELALKSDDLASSEKYISKLELMKANDVNKNRFKLSKAQYLLKKGRLKNRAEALSLLESIIMDSYKYFNTSFRAMILLVQLLIEDYQSTKDESIISEIKDYISNLESVTESKYFEISLTVIKSKLMLLEGKFNLAENLLYQNKEIARSLGLFIQEQEIIREIEKITQEKEEWMRILQSEYLFEKKFKMADFMSYLEEAKQIIR